MPRRAPFTKPKALNYALPLARGAHVVVFDAEDAPEPAQLRRAASLFHEDSTLECLQAELVIANGQRSWVAGMFSAEYAGHFGVLLPAMARAGYPLPFGGTSNHFRTATLRRIGGWDAFNVTENADLGIRMARLGLKVTSFAAITWEEAPETFGSWIKQRSRWMKGWMQTLLVHPRRPRRLLADLGWSSLLAFYLFVGGMVLAIASHGVFLTAMLLDIAIRLATDGTVDFWTLSGILTLFLGYCGAAAVSLIGLERLGQGRLILTMLGLPLYWVIAGYALAIAIYELIFRPYHWAKTSHKGYPGGQPTTAHPTQAYSNAPASKPVVVLPKQ